MLERLTVRGLGIIDQAVLEPEPGFVVLTGETGAGKSLLVESLKLLAGQRAQSDLVRSGDERLVVEGWFRLAGSPSVDGILAELGVEHDGTLVVRRELTAEGRGRAWLNDLAVTAGSLQRLAPHLLAIHGQHEQYGLAEPVEQRRLVDEFGGLERPCAEVAAAWSAWQEADQELRRLEAARDRRRDRLDAIAFQLAEIDALGPQPGEDERLRERRQLLRHAVRLLELSGAVLGRLSDDDGAVVDALAQAGREVEQMAACGLSLNGVLQRLDEAEVAVAEAVRQLQELSGGIEEDPAELDSLETRLARLEQLMLKYGSPVERLLEHRDHLEAERRELEGMEVRLGVASSAAREALAVYSHAAQVLDSVRRSAGDSLLETVAGLLGRLNMGQTRVEFQWAARPDGTSPLERDGRPVAFDAGGIELPELLIAPNPGEELRPMARIASGGELSRLHLAVRTALRGRRGETGLTLLFDEVDSGLGGTTAAALAGLLAELARVDQVMVVTHLPQVAALAGCHFRVEKVEHEGRAVTRVERLTGEAREREVARMLSGERLGPSALAHARTLLGQP
jgi:DNA repair protein RecN (Recombination protein N)